MNEGPCGATGHAGGLIMEDQKPMQSGLNAEKMYFSSYTWARGRAAPGLAPSGAQSIVQDLTPFHQPPPVRPRVVSPLQEVKKWGEHVL